ncbi:hypothetical protein [Glaesserella parasuis]
MSIRFDKLRFVKKLQEANQPPEVAEAFAEAFADALDDALEQSQRTLLSKADFELRMTQMEAKFDTKLAQLETRLTDTMYKMAGIIVAAMSLIMGLMRFIN